MAWLLALKETCPARIPHIVGKNYVNDDILPNGNNNYFKLWRLAGPQLHIHPFASEYPECLGRPTEISMFTFEFCLLSLLNWLI